MKRIVLFFTVISFILTACGQSGPAPAIEPSPASPDSFTPTAALPATSPAPAIPTNAPTIAAHTPTLPPTAVPPSVTATDTPTLPPATPTSARPRPTAASSGRLSVAIYVANCRSAPTATKPGGIVIQISVEVQGGNGVYKYFDNEGGLRTSKFIDIDWEKGARLLGKVTVTSGDGQTVEKEYSISPSELNCP